MGIEQYERAADPCMSHEARGIGPHLQWKLTAEDCYCYYSFPVAGSPTIYYTDGEMNK